MELTSRRLLLRAFRPEDGPGLYEYLSDPEVVRYEPYGVMDRDACLREAATRSQSEEFIAVCLQGEERLIGNLYFAQREMGSWELGYVFSRRYQGRGYATEAVRRLLAHAFTRMPVHRVFAQCDPDNVSSWRLMERLGMRREGHFRRNVCFRAGPDGQPLWTDSYLYALLKEEFEAGAAGADGCS